VPVGKAKVARNGEDVTAIAYGLMFHETLKAAEELANQGVSVEVIDLRTLHPLDKETILNLRFALNRSDIWQPK
jgi:pyruvate/2-oxoglutarate/acetoin dehydrogenase E1 component